MLIKSLTREQQLAWDLAVRRRLAGTTRQQRGKNRDQPPPDGKALEPAPVSCNQLFRPSRASIQPAVVTYAPASLLGATMDIRLLIYGLIEDDIKRSRSQWNGKAKTPYDSLRMVSRQVYHELEITHWQHWLVRQNRISDLLNLQFFKEGIVYSKTTGKLALNSNSPMLKDFQSLTLEVDLTSSLKLLAQLTVAVQTLPLSELKLFFTGKDGHGTQTHTGSCGLHPGSSFRKLPATGQLFSDRARFVNTLMKLENLETLVVSNANLPVTYNQVINNKPRLSKLSVVPDRRTSLTYDWHAAQNASNPWLQEAARGSNIKLNVKDMPPLLELEISTNAMVFSSAVVNNALRSLEKLTWIVPDPSHQAGDIPGRDLNWLSQTKDILQLAAMHTNDVKLKTLRICFEHGIYDTAMDLARNDQYEVGELVNALQCDLKNIRSLRNFEIHMDYVCKFVHDGFHFVANLGDHLERYYISEKMITADNSMIPDASVGVTDEEFSQDPPLAEDANLHAPAALRLSIHHNLVRQMTRDNFGVSSFSSFKIDKQLSPAQEEQLKPRTDRILNHKNLAFLGYEFTEKQATLRVVESTDDAPIALAEDLPIDDDDRLRLLRLNGRLLDRERNKHMYAIGYRLPAAENEAPANRSELPTRHYPTVVRPCRHDHWMCEL